MGFTMHAKNKPIPQRRKWNSISCMSVKLYQFGNEFIKNDSQKNTGSFRFEVMSFPKYSKQREVIQKMNI